VEDLLAVCKLPYNEKRPAVCLDETNRQLIEEKKTPRPVQPGQTALHGYEYKRNGAANLFMMFEPLAQRRGVKVMERRAMQDFAHCLWYPAAMLYPFAEKIILVLDNLNTRPPASLYAAFEPETARRLCERFEIHYTPKHGSRLNMAELEIGIMSRQRLDRRIPAFEKMASGVQAWVAERNNHKSTVRWHFATADAGIKLQHLYPKF
jgi:hypothetical protein